jgi:L-lysine exporter family protein LysE/ArgO
MLHFFLIGLLLGWGAAIPIGPINVEVIRRNLSLGTYSGISFGLGACSADVTYLFLLSAGLLLFLNHGMVLQIISLIGAGILMWFGYQAFRTKNSSSENLVLVPQPLWQQYLHGYLLTLLNPFTVLFWSSVSALIVVLGKQGDVVMGLLGGGVLIATMSWIIGLNLVLHFTRHRFSNKVVVLLNKIGGVFLLMVALFSLVHTFKL